MIRASPRPTLSAVRVTRTSRASQGFPTHSAGAAPLSTPHPSADGFSIALGLGANLGRPRERFRVALRGLEAAGFRIEASSSLYASAPVGYDDQPDFINAVVVGRWPGGPTGLLRVTRRLEEAAGRTRTFRNAPRTLDVDLLLAPGVGSDGPELRLPHPRWKERSFVLAPLAEVAPGWTDPSSGETVEEIWIRARPALPPVEVVGPPSELWRPPT